MTIAPIRTQASAFVILLGALGMTLGACVSQPIGAPVEEASEAPAFTNDQLAQLLAPIALYPDPLLAQILTASTYPTEISAARDWLQIPANAALKGDALVMALQQQPWEPSVKSLVPFPEILFRMANRIDETTELGDAVLSQQLDVMETIRHLRSAAIAAGALKSTPQQTVTVAGQSITIEPTNPASMHSIRMRPGRR